MEKVRCIWCQRLFNPSDVTNPVGYPPAYCSTDCETNADDAFYEIQSKGE